MTEIHLGYEVGTGRAVAIPLRHTAVTGQTQESGKTTTLEGLITRSELRAVAYVTKRGESSFHVANPIPPYFQERADWKFVQSLLEASTETKLKFEQSWIMRASEGARTLQDVRANILKFLHGVPDLTLRKLKKKKRGAEDDEPAKRWIQKPARGLSGDIYYVLDKYLDDVMPQLAAMPYSSTLDLAPGVNVMDLRDYEFPLQALVVRSVIDWTREHEENTINVIPEAWKFAPKQKGSPVRQSAEELIREGGVLKNFLWIDSQDLAGVADVLMRQVGVWIFGVQRAKHEIERALDHMPEGLPVRRPRAQDIATLSKGQFYVCFGREMYKVYVQPAWMSAAHAQAIALGEEEVDSARPILERFDHERKNTDRQHDLLSSRHAKVAQRKGDLRSGASCSDAKVERESGTADRSNGVLGETQQDEEAMWKEKYEELKVQFDQLVAGLEKAFGYTPGYRPPSHLPDHVKVLREAHDAMAKQMESGGGKRNGEKNGSRSASLGAEAADRRPVNGASSLDDIYLYIKERAAQDPGILQLLRQVPELQVTVERKMIEMSSSNLRGALAILISEKFFDLAVEFAAVRKELIRRGFIAGKTPNLQISQALQALTEFGFLTKEEDNSFQAVPGMKVNIVEERA